MGPQFGWIDLDPTNGLIVADEHVVLGWGRDYSDTCPVRGVILGGGDHSVTAGVDLVAALSKAPGQSPWPFSHQRRTFGPGLAWRWIGCWRLTGFWTVTTKGASFAS